MRVAPLQASDGILLIGHGTRDPGGVADFLTLAERVRGRLSPLPVEACFLEIAEPTIPAGLHRLIARGARRITIVPLLLTAAGHAKRDIPRAIAEVIGENGNVAVRQSQALECHSLLVDLSTRRYVEALAGRAAIEPAQTLLLFVGRGSSDSEALATVRRFAALRGERSHVGRVETCFAAVARPTLEETLSQIGAAGSARIGFQRIVVQPHLLFRGRLLDEIREAVARAATMSSAVGALSAAGGEGWEIKPEWIVSEPLGPEPELVSAVIEMIGEMDRQGADGNNNQHRQPLE